MEKVSCTDRVRNEEVQQESRRTRISYTQRRRKLTRLVISCIETTIYSVLLKENKKGRETEEVDTSSYWMTLRKYEYTGN